MAKKYLRKVGSFEEMNRADLERELSLMPEERLDATSFLGSRSTK